MSVNIVQIETDPPQLIPSTPPHPPPPVPTPPCCITGPAPPLPGAARHPQLARRESASLGICLTRFSTSEAQPSYWEMDSGLKMQRRASSRKVAERAWCSKKRAKWFVGVIGLLVLFFLMNCVMLLRLQDHGIRSESGFSGNSSVSSVSVTIREKWRKIGKGKKAQKGNYGRMLALASHALAEGQNKPVPKDLWLEPLVPAVSWKPCSDQRSWEPNAGKNGYILVTANGGMNQQRVAVSGA
ncbi:hypothetical protein ACFX15_036365 [Malus domestica]